MKNLLLILITLLFFSCGGMYYKAASTTSRKVYIGMPIEEFKDIARKKAKLAAMESGYTVFRMTDHNAWSDGWSADVVDTRFFYFDSFFYPRIS